MAPYEMMARFEDPYGEIQARNLIERGDCLAANGLIATVTRSPTIAARESPSIV